MSTFPTGVTVVTIAVGSEVHGMTANAVTSVSLNPPSCLVVIGEEYDSYTLIPRAGRFTLNILPESAAYISDLFAGRHAKQCPDPFQAVRWTPSPGGAPMLDVASAVLDLRLDAVHAAFDHAIFIGVVEHAEVRTSDHPLIYWRSGYHSVAEPQD